MASRSFDAGISLIETTIMLLAISILTGVIAPTAKRTIDQARLARVVTDEAAISTAILAFRTDTARRGFNQDGSVAEPAVGSTTHTETLVSDGDTPTCVTTPDQGCNTAPLWKNVVNNTAANNTTDFLERHLVTNTPTNSIARAYATATWRGAYMTAPMDPDPWGNRYAVNVKWLSFNSNCSARLANDVFVLSAGPDETIDTPYRFDMPNCNAGTAGTTGAYPVGDDMIKIIIRDINATVP